MSSPLSPDFSVPTNAEVSATSANDLQGKCVYLCGNSLGLPSRRSLELIKQEVDIWSAKGVVGQFDHPHNRPWTTFTEAVTPLLAEVVGAKEPEVACMGTLTSNLHLMLGSFYNPTPNRYKILCEAKAFPSDQYAFASQTLSHGYDPSVAVREVSPREGEATLREEDILDIIEKEGKDIALVIFSGVQYYTGQLFPMETITKAAQAQGCICGWDLAHAVGNVPISLHDWGADFAVWCTYKYLNSSPGGIAGIFIHEKWDNGMRPKYAGWWGHEMATRFKMPPVFKPIPGAQGYQQSNTPILSAGSLLGSLQTFKAAGMMTPIRERSIALTATLERGLKQSKYYISTSKALAGGQTKPAFTILTPSEPARRGAQLSLLFLPIGSGVMQKVFAYMAKHGVIGDEREPDVIRIAPAALYNTVHDCEEAASCLIAAMDNLSH